MKKRLHMSLFLVVVTLLWSSNAFSIDPPPTPNPNGFISGTHFNLNIIGKKAGFICPEVVPGEYGNVIFIPEYGGPVDILMQSGKGAKFETVPELQVIDPCTFDDGKATLQLPKNTKGYWVFARTLAKPGTDGSRNISFQPDLNMVLDEAGNQLLFMGSLNPDGTVCKESLKDGETIITCSLARSKGQSKAVNITGIFEWSGFVYYFDPTGLSDSTIQWLCCSQEDTDADGYLEYVDCALAADQVSPSCTLPQVAVQAYGVEYGDAWVFNIADFVEYLWSIDNSGVKLLQVRFYPIP